MLNHIGKWLKLADSDKDILKSEIIFVLYI